MRGRILLLACGLAIATLLWGLLGSQPGAASPAPAASARPPVAAPLQPAAQDDAWQPSVDERIEVTGGGGAVTPTPRRVRILAVLAPEQTPAAGAEVRYWPPRSTAQRQRGRKPWAGNGDLEAALRASGALAIAGDQGDAEVDAEDGSEVVVRCGEFYGEADLAADRGPPLLPLRIELRRDIHLRVAVVDDRGRPCADVYLLGTGSFAARASGSCEDRDFDLGPTDQHGLATFPHLQRTLPPPDADVFDWALQLSCKGSHLAGVTRAVAWQEVLAPEPIRFVLPAGGAIVLEIRDLDGLPFGCQPALRDLASELVCTPTRTSWRTGYVFDNVPLGRTWRAFAADLFAQDIAGPARPLETVRARIEVLQHGWQLEGRLQRSDGVALAHAQLQLSVRAEGLGAVHRQQLRSDGQGHFALAFHLPGRVQRLCGVDLQVMHAADAEARNLAVDREMLPGATDLGILAVPVPPTETLLASVEVRGDGRNLTATAWADLRLADDHKHRVPSLRRRDGDRFLFVGSAPDVPMVVVCGHAGYLWSGPTPVAVGAHLAVDLRPAAQLWLPIMPPSVPRELLHAELRPVTAAGGEPEEAGLSDSGVFHWDSLRPGPHRLRIFADQRAVFEVAVIELRPGVNVWPEAGALLDLRTRARAIYLPVAEAATGRRVDDVQRLALTSGATVLPGGWEMRLEPGDWVVVPEHPVDLLFCAPGFVPQRLVQPTRDTRVLLQRCTTVQLGPPAGERLRVVVEIVADAVRDPALRQMDRNNVHASFDDEVDGAAVALDYAPGTVLQVHTVRGGVRSSPQRVVVGEASPQQITLR